MKPRGLIGGPIPGPIGGGGNTFIGSKPKDAARIGMSLFLVLAASTIFLAIEIFGSINSTKPFNIKNGVLIAMAATLVPGTSGSVLALFKPLVLSPMLPPNRLTYWSSYL